MRNKPVTPGRLVKLDMVDDDMVTADTAVDETQQENCGSESDHLETQSGDIAIEDENEAPLKLDDQPLNEQMKSREKVDSLKIMKKTQGIEEEKKEDGKVSGGRKGVKLRVNVKVKTEDGQESPLTKKTTNDGESSPASISIGNKAGDAMDSDSDSIDMSLTDQAIEVSPKDSVVLLRKKSPPSPMTLAALTQTDVDDEVVMDAEPEEDEAEKSTEVPDEKAKTE